MFALMELEECRGVAVICGQKPSRAWGKAVTDAGGVVGKSDTEGW